MLGAFLILLPVALVAPWLLVLDPDGLRARLGKAQSWLAAVGVVVGLRLFLSVVLTTAQDRERLIFLGRVYGSVLQILVVAGLFLLAFTLLLAVWPRGGAVALAAFREGIRQPLFWLLAGATVVLLVLSLVIPYFTFGDDYKMMKQIGFDLVMLVTGLFAVITASVSISEEIEGRTAITLMSKPLSRRQFLLGKFLGILLASLLLAAVLGWFLNWALYAKMFLEFDDVVDALQVQVQPGLNAALQSLAADRETGCLLEGAAAWTSGAAALLPGLVIISGQAMLFLAIAAALATRLPLIANLNLCLTLFFLGNLAPHLVRLAQDVKERYGVELVEFMAQLMNTVLPALEYFGPGTAIVRDQPLPLGAYSLHALYVTGYSILYSAIALLFGMILFEDRDLA